MRVVIPTSMLPKSFSVQTLFYLNVPAMTRMFKSSYFKMIYITFAPIKKIEKVHNGITSRYRRTSECW